MFRPQVPTRIGIAPIMSEEGGGDCGAEAGNLVAAGRQAARSEGVSIWNRAAHGQGGKARATDGLMGPSTDSATGSRAVTGSRVLLLLERTPMKAIRKLARRTECERTLLSAVLPTTARTADAAIIAGGCANAVSRLSQQVWESNQCAMRASACVCVRARSPTRQCVCALSRRAIGAVGGCLSYRTAQS